MVGEQICVLWSEVESLGFRFSKSSRSNFQEVASGRPEPRSKLTREGYSVMIFNIHTYIQVSELNNWGFRGYQA